MQRLNPLKIAQPEGLAQLRSLTTKPAKLRDLPRWTTSAG